MNGQFFDPEQLRAKVRELKEQAHQTTDATEREKLLSAARTYLLLATNAAWLASTDDFLKAVEEKQPWPHPHLADDQTKRNG
jgi:hypothetical protein